jgi:hypothetical protein
LEQKKPQKFINKVKEKENEKGGRRKKKKKKKTKKTKKEKNSLVRFLSCTLQTD